VLVERDFVEFKNVLREVREGDELLKVCSLIMGRTSKQKM
jgi:hypothetical protein